MVKKKEIGRFNLPCDPPSSEEENQQGESMTIPGNRTHSIRKSSHKIKENVKILIIGQVIKTYQIPKCKKQATAIAGPTCKKSYYEVLGVCAKYFETYRCICAFTIDNRLTPKIKLIPNPNKRHKPSITVNLQVVEQIKLIKETPSVSDVLRELCTHTKSSYDTFNGLIVSELNNLKKEQEFTSKEVKLLKRKVSDLGARGDPYDDSSSESEDPQEENDEQ